MPGINDITMGDLLAVFLETGRSREPVARVRDRKGGVVNVLVLDGVSRIDDGEGVSLISSLSVTEE